MANKRKSDIPNKIIKHLTHFKKLTFSELKDITSTSSPTLSYHLKSLQDEKIIKFEKIGKEKHYTISESRLKTAEAKIQIISENYNMFFESEIKPYYDTPIDKSLIYIRDMMSGFFLYTLMKSMETGENWFKGFDINSMAQEVLRFMITRIFEDKKEVRDKLIKIMYKSMDEFFKESKKEAKKAGDEYYERLGYVLEHLENNYPAELTFLQREASRRIG